ncbi:hypothetical protein ACIBCT_35085 [Streptosporangium sp. NPDC050855]|uniref:hypothetical protein n=1 Tax=Streptosporangium sp. NPDC050855 TaxID=3366194 RepID=UPI00379A820B
MNRYLVDLAAAVKPEDMPPSGTAIAGPGLAAVYMNRAMGVISARYIGEAENPITAAIAANETFFVAVCRHIKPGLFEITQVSSEKAPEVPQEKI